MMPFKGTGFIPEKKRRPQCAAGSGHAARVAGILLLVAVMGVLHLSCGDGLKQEWEYLVDNPLDESITIRIDTKEYVIPAHTTVPVGIIEGRHTLTCNGSSAKFVTKVNSDRSVTILNPTLSNYLLSGCVDGDGYEYHSDTGMVKLPVQVVNSLFIDRTHTYWSFGPDEEAALPAVSAGSSRRVVYRKLFRETDYRNAFAGELPPGIVFPANTGTLGSQPAYAFPIETLMCDCEAANEAIRRLGETCDAVIAHSDNLFHDVEQLAHTALTGVFSEIDEKCGAQYNPAHDVPGYKKMFGKLGQAMKYMTDASTFIVSD